MIAGQDVRASYYTLHAMDRFLEEWSSLHPLMGAARMNALQVLMALEMLTV